MKKPRPERNERRDARPERASPFTAQAFFVDGMAAFAEYVRFRPDALIEVRCAKKERPAVERLLSEHKLRLPIGEREQRNDGEGSPVSARVNLKALTPDDWERRIAGRENDLILALDHITDPRNLGAIVRSAAFFGVKEVVVPERRQVLLTQAAVNTAQGGFALADLVCVVNLGRALSALKEQGYWIIGTAMDGEDMKKVAGEYKKVVLVLGNEETGLSRNVRELCDRAVAIRGKGGLESLNVSVATGICLSAFAAV